MMIIQGISVLETTIINKKEIKEKVSTWKVKFLPKVQNFKNSKMFSLLTPPQLIIMNHTI
jgi:hypothetical protein